MQQPNFFGHEEKKYPHAPGFAKKRETSKQAAAAIKNLNERQQVVFNELMRGDATDHELCKRLKMDMCQVQPRRSELTEIGKAMDSGMTRLTPYNRNAIVWRAVGK